MPDYGGFEVCLVDLLAPVSCLKALEVYFSVVPKAKVVHFLCCVGFR